jgi:tRNA-dihydrouridine synthase
MKSFWDDIRKPFFVMAPMADVTDAAYRKLIAEVGKPDVTWTEFVSADGLYHTREMKKMPDAENPLMRDLIYSEIERPIVAQLFSSKPEMMEYAAKLCADLGFDGVDINMGCPDKSIEKQGCGAAMIKNPELAKEIVMAARRGATRSFDEAMQRGEKTKYEEPISVTVKTRIGYNKESINEWIPELLALKLPALTVHLRTRKEMSKVAAHWELMPQVIALRDKISPETLIIGNGDVKSVEEASQKAELFEADGVMLGRAIFGNPYLFSRRTPDQSTDGSEARAITERLCALATLAHNFEQLRPSKSFHIFRKHIKAFVSGFDGAAELRQELMECENNEQVARVIASTNLVY